MPRMYRQRINPQEVRIARLCISTADESKKIDKTQTKMNWQRLGDKGQC